MVKVKNHKISKTVTKHLMNIGRELGSVILKTPPKQKAVQQGAGIGRMVRHGPSKIIRNTIPKMHMYHQ